MTPTPADVVVETARRLRETGLCVSSLGNVSARNGEYVWITPTRRWAWGLSAEQIILVGLDGRLRSTGEPSRELPLHLAIYRRMAGVAAVVHTHSPWATAWSHRYETLPGGTEEMRYHDLNDIPCVPAHAAGSDALAHAAAAELERTPVVLLGGHGVLAVGRSATEAFELCALAEQQAQVRWLLSVHDQPAVLRATA